MATLPLCDAEKRKRFGLSQSLVIAGIGKAVRFLINKIFNVQLAACSVGE
jgi:hypothetical protein